MSTPPISSGSSHFSTPGLPTQPNRYLAKEAIITALCIAALLFVVAGVWLAYKYFTKKDDGDLTTTDQKTQRVSTEILSPENDLSPIQESEKSHSAEETSFEMTWEEYLEYAKSVLAGTDSKEQYDIAKALKDTLNECPGEIRQKSKEISDQLYWKSSSADYHRATLEIIAHKNIYCKQTSPYVDYNRGTPEQHYLVAKLLENRFLEYNLPYIENPEEIIADLYWKAGEKRHALAKNCYRNFLIQGHSAETKPSWLKDAAEADSKEACLCLAYLHFFGPIKFRDVTKAESYFVKAANLGDEEAKSYLGFMRQVLEWNFSDAAADIYKASDPQIAINDLYLKTENNVSVALGWLARALDKGLTPHAHPELNAASAKGLYMKAAMSGYEPAIQQILDVGLPEEQYQLAEKLKQRLPSQKDWNLEEISSKIAALYRKAALARHQKAQSYHIKLIDDGAKIDDLSSTSEKIDTAVEIYQMAASFESEKAKSWLGLMTRLFERDFCSQFSEQDFYATCCTYDPLPAIGQLRWMTRGLFPSETRDRAVSLNSRFRQAGYLLGLAYEKGLITEGSQKEQKKKAHRLYWEIATAYFSPYTPAIKHLIKTNLLDTGSWGEQFVLAERLENGDFSEIENKRAVIILL
ncbi:MAG: hypothetical protein ACXWM7_01540, partial [Parachlamydiaceae bacterium]